MITVVLLEHPRPMLRVLRESLSGEPDMRVVGEAGTLDRGLAPRSEDGVDLTSLFWMQRSLALTR